MSLPMQSPAAVALAWALIHFLWEGAATAAILAALLRLGRDWPSRWRYAAAAVALFALPLAFGITAALYLGPDRTEVTRFIREAYPVTAAPSSLDIDLPAAAWRDYLAWLTPVWMLGVLLCYIRSLGGWLAVRRLRVSGICAAPERWHARLKLPASVPLLESCRIDVPMVVGLMRPAILVPVGFAAGLAPSQVEAILLHEMAHIRRHDPLVNLLQNFIEGLLFYHPAVWWISSMVRAEREHCCDDLVVAATGDPRGYAAALTALELARLPEDAALAANGGSLVKRIRRMLNQPAAARPAAAPVLQSIAILLMAAVALAAWQSKPAPQARPVQATPYEKWLADDVAYIISDQERATFKALQTDEEREHFIEQFWQRRDPTPGTPANEFKEEHYRRIAYSNEHFASFVAGWKTDRGRIYIIYGPPDEIDSHPRGAGSTPPYEVWFYRMIEATGSPTWCFFAGSDYRLAPAGSPLRRAIPQQKPPVPGVRELPLR